MIDPVYDRDGITLYRGDVLAMLAALPADSIDCVVTSPPYWSLRTYSGGGVIWGGDADHAHAFAGVSRNGATVEGYGGTGRWQHAGHSRRSKRSARGERPNDWARITRPSGICDCGAWSGQYGLEPTPELYVEHTVTVLQAIRRVLKPSGVCWWNVADSYIGGGRGLTEGREAAWRQLAKRWPKPGGLKPKDLVLIPQRVALAAQADGWYVRCDVIWSKPNPIPESVTDRPTKSHEYVWLLTKSKRYFWNQDAVREPFTDARIQRIPSDDGSGRNIRSVWTIPTQPSPPPHFASFPEQLAETCINAACPKDGVVLDPFAGTGTALKVARDRGRRAIGIEISSEYCELAQQRLDYGIEGVLAIAGGQIPMRQP